MSARKRHDEPFWWDWSGAFPHHQHFPRLPLLFADYGLYRIMQAVMRLRAERHDEQQGKSL